MLITLLLDGECEQNGQTALHFLKAEGSEDIARILIEHGANANAVAKVRCQQELYLIASSGLTITDLLDVWTCPTERKNAPARSDLENVLGAGG